MDSEALSVRKTRRVRIAVVYLDQQLEIVSEMGDSVAEARAHFAMGNVRLAQSGHEKEAMKPSRCYRKLAGSRRRAMTKNH